MMKRQLKNIIMIAMMMFIFGTSLLIAQSKLTIATVNNPHMITMQKYTSEFEKQNPNIKIEWVTLEEGILRQRVTTDIATKGGQFDIMTIGFYEVPIWSRKGWLKKLKLPASYDVNDLLPTIRGGASYKRELYAVPFYGESSMIMYRKDIFDKNNIILRDNPTWGEIYDIAGKLDDRGNGFYGICLRGKPGWGDNMAILTTMVNAFGGRWFDENWKPEINSPAWNHAISFYVDLMNKYGPPGATANSFNENLTLLSEGKCAMWIDATIAASLITDKRRSKFASKFAFAQAPVAVTDKGANWLWSWMLAIPSSSKKSAAAEKFLAWATSKDYIKLIGSKEGWGTVPTGTRKSTYANANFKKAASFASAEIKAINSADPITGTLYPKKYVGVQFAAIPEFQSIGILTGQQIASALAGKVSVEKALETAQKGADRIMRKAKYYK
ncbi:sugar ABC transporter substrate-binding protein [Spirochaetota bacterium]|nr:sugar ABC transporter substrate-binding protein [Spirochaetota bacterium]